MQRLERLINLTATLLHTDRALTAEEVRERVPGYGEGGVAFRRAFQRDKETLREMGVPVATELVDPSDPSVEGYRIPRQAYELPDPGLAPEELAALHLAASAVRLEGAPGTEALWKLGGLTATPPPATVAALPGSEHLAALFGAVGERRAVAFAYRGRRRTVDPYRLSFRTGHWYLAGRDHDADDRRSFRVDRMEPPVTLGPPVAFERPPDEDTADPFPWEWGDGTELTAMLLVDANQSGWAVGHLGDQAVVETRPDGSVLFGVRVTDASAFRSFVLGFLDHAEVVGPPDLRSSVVEWLEALCHP